MSASWLADKIEQWPTAKLLPYARNARTHSDEQVAQIAASIAEFGFTNPILAGADGVIVAGHGRLAAAHKLGLALVPVVVLEHLSPTQRRALVIADNRIAENAGWDEAMLRIELVTLQDDDFDVSLTGFDADALADLLADEDGNGDGETDDDAVPEITETPISRPGDVWLLGGHRLLCGDSTKAECFEQLLQGEQVDMVFTDPPYNVNYANTAKDKMRGTNRAILNDNLGDGFYDFLLAALMPTIANCRGGIYVAMSSSELDVLQSAFREAGGKWSTFVIWAKNTFTLGRADYQRQPERDSTMLRVSSVGTCAGRPVRLAFTCWSFVRRPLHSLLRALAVKQPLRILVRWRHGKHCHQSSPATAARSHRRTADPVPASAPAVPSAPPRSSWCRNRRRDRARCPGSSMSS